MTIRKWQTLLLFGLFSSGTILAETAPPAVTTDGLHLVDGTQMARVYAKPGTDLSQYNSVYVVKPQVAFTKDWQRKQNNIPGNTVTKEDMQRIRSELADLFVDVFIQELTDNGGYTIADDIGEDVLVVSPAIVDLNVIAPSTPRNRQSRSVIASAGSMTLYMELIDSVTGDKLVRAIDNKYDRTYPNPIQSNAKRNEAAARELLGEWAQLLRAALDEARSVVKGS